MERRSFIKYTGLVTVTIFVPVSACNSISGKDKVLSVPRDLLSIMSEDGIEELGNSYLATFPEEANSDKLKMLIGKNKKLVSNRSISQEIKIKVKKDFVKGDTVILNGWVLSRTEARQCALYSLIQ